MTDSPVSRNAAGLLVACAAVIASAGWSVVRPSAQSVAPDPLAAELDRRLTADVRPLLATYCLTCHTGAEAKGDVNLDALTSVRAALGMGDALTMAHELVTTRQMPPDDKPQPTDLERLILAQWLEGVRDYVPPDAAVDPGWFTIHRLNRAEYRNTLRDLLGINPAEHDLTARLPDDDTGYGFDNIADVLSTSPLAVEQYLSSAERAIEIGLGPVIEIGGAPRPVRPLRTQPAGQTLPGGGGFLTTNGAVYGQYEFPADGEYRVRVEAWETRGGDEHARLSLRLDGREQQAFFISGTREEPETVEAVVRVKAGKRAVAANFTNDFWRPKVDDRNLGVESITIVGPLDEATTERSTAWRAVFAPDGAGSAPADETDRAAAIIERFAARAYRRPIDGPEQQALLALYHEQRKEGQAFEPAVRGVLSATLVSPNFLFRWVNNPWADDPAAMYRLDGYELASRLSYFLWSSTPDEALLAAAADGSLASTETLVAQTRRMIADEKARAFVENFSGQWLHLRMLDSLAIDTSRFPEFDAALRADMLTEARLVFTDALRGERTLLSLLDGRETFLNERLARFYGVEGVQGSEFRRVTLPDSSPRGGILTMGAVLTVTSNPTRTSPVKRGLYVLDQFLGTPPPPPPADIPRLEQAQTARPDATLREQLAAHVANPNCAVCHNRLDPIGLAFENFDAIGRWRTDESGQSIDASGTLPGGITVSGAADIKAYLSGRGDQFIETLAAKVLTYAVGRGPEPFDRPAVRRIREETRRDGDRLATLIEAVVTSDTFRTCRGRERE